MNLYQNYKPINRSKFRIALGKYYFTGKRRISWLMNRKLFATEKLETPLEYHIFKHQTPLYRGLKDQDRRLEINKVTNLSLASNNISGIVIQPGQTFSYWKLIGKPTRLKGYKEGLVLHYGQLTSGTGGGLCQLSNLIFWMAIHTPLTIKERHRHSYDVFPDSNRTQPFGSGATCVYNYRDLQIENQTHETYQIIVWLEEGYLKGQIRSDKDAYFDYKVYEKEAQITHEMWGNYLRHNAIWKDVYDLEGQLVYSDKICENHALMMYEPFIESHIK